MYYMMTPETEDKKPGDIDQLSQNYEKMNEAGKQKLKQVADQILGIHEIVNEEAHLGGKNGRNR